MALKRRRLAEQVVGFVRRKNSIAECKRAGAVHVATLDLREAVEDADLIIFCTPLAQMQPLAQKMLPWIKKGALVSDVGSVKVSVVRDLEPLFKRAGAEFVGSHPMAGAEKLGVAFARADLFKDAVCVITPTPRSKPATVQKIGRLWKSVGARLLVMNAQSHDEFVSRSSHLPYVLAAHLASYVLDPAHPTEQTVLCANGFRDTTRVASGSPEMWRDIAGANRKNLSRALGKLVANLSHFKRALEKEDDRTITNFLEEAKKRRDTWASKL